jgi:hypothetical protein
VVDKEDQFGACKPKSKVSSSYRLVTEFIRKCAMVEQRLSRTEQREQSLMEEHKLSRHELYDNREITIFRLGDKAYLPGLSKVEDLKKSVLDTVNALEELSKKVEAILNKVGIWHSQCRHLVEEYRKGKDRIVKELGALVSTVEGPVAGLNPPLLTFICSKILCSMWEGEALLLFCGKNNYNRAAFALSSPPTCVPTFSKFALVLQELEWTVDFICYIKDLCIASDESFNDWYWCENRRKLVFQGNLGIAEEQAPGILEADCSRQADDRSALLISLILKPISSPLLSPLYHLSWWTTWWTGLDPHNQHQLEGIWKKRLLTPSHDLGSDSDPDWFWIDRPEFKLGKDLGKGASKHVKKCKWFGEEVAVAEVDVFSKDLVEAEVGLFARAQHPNVVELMGCAYEDHERDPKCSLVIEVMEQDLGALISEQLKSQNSHEFGIAHGGPYPPFSLPVAVDIVVQIVEAMIHVQKCNVLHRDLKPSNCLVCPKFWKGHLTKRLNVPMYYTVKLIDFGESKLHAEGSFFRTYNKGTTRYMAPEVYKKGEKLDGSLDEDVYT